MKPFPKVILLFLAVDWPIFMRRPMVTALGEEAAKFGTAVIAVNRPLCPFTTLIRKPGRFKELFERPGLEKIGDNLYLFSPRYFIHDHLAGEIGPLENLNLTILRRNFRRLFDRLGLIEKSPLVWYYYPQQGYLTRLFPGSFNIYEIYDNLTDISGNEIKYLIRMEKKWRDKINLVLTANQDIFDRYAKNYKTAWVFGNGLDRTTYLQLGECKVKPLPAIESIPHPRIGYAGMVSDRLDWDLIRDLAAARPGWQFIFAGRLDDSKIPKKFTSFDNVHFTGEYDHNQVPAILNSFDIAILPYRDNEFFHNFKPLKFYEYAAAGLPTVSTRSDELKLFSPDFVKTVPGQKEKWLEAVEIQLNADKKKLKEIGREIASHYIWDNMTADLLRKLNNHLGSL